MKKLLIMLVIALCGLGLAGNAMAVPAPPVGSLAVDFRTAPWAPANLFPIFGVGPVTALALPQGAFLYQDGTDGLGVQGSYGTETDEIDNVEALAVTFAAPTILTGVWISDLFAASSTDINEFGQVSINGGAAILFFGAASDQANGEQFVTFGGPIPVLSALFTIFPVPNNEYSVIGFEGRAAVPEPATMLLLGLGLIGLAGLRRKM